MEMNLRLLTTSLLLLCLVIGLNAKELIIDGTYQGENIYIQNPFSNKENGFCIKEVYVNDKPFTEINSSAFEITLESHEIGKYVKVSIIHSKSCKPRVLNKDALRSKSTFEIVSFKSAENQLRFTTKNESNEEPFLVEQFKNNKWVEVTRMKGEGPEGFNNYISDVEHTSGLNKYRIKQRDLGNRFRYSKVLEYKSNRSPITFYPKRVSNVIHLSEACNFEVFDSFGALMAKGHGNKIDVSALEEGVYYLNIDNRTEKFLKK
tara:strand:- start:871 stop:1656 length:786 start_codon:yes stop_codon:yes gene_type:complete